MADSDYEKLTGPPIADFTSTTGGSGEQLQAELDQLNYDDPPKGGKKRPWPFNRKETALSEAEIRRRTLLARSRNTQRVEAMLTAMVPRDKRMSQGPSEESNGWPQPGFEKILRQAKQSAPTVEQAVGIAAGAAAKAGWITQKQHKTLSHMLTHPPIDEEITAQRENERIVANAYASEYKAILAEVREHAKAKDDTTAARVAFAQSDARQMFTRQDRHGDPQELKRWRQNLKIAELL